MLVAGPVYQASVEFGEFETKHRELGVDDLQVPAPSPMSPWWWLLAPVTVALHVRRARSRRDALLDAAPTEAVQAHGAYSDLAVGWVVVAAGARPPVLLALSALFAVLRTRASRRSTRRCRRP